MKEFSDHIFHYRGFQRLQELINYCLCTRRWCAILKENELFSFIRTGSAALIAPDSALVGFRPGGNKNPAGGGVPAQPHGGRGPRPLERIRIMGGTRV